jgi:hypothetical protein
MRFFPNLRIGAPLGALTVLVTPDLAAAIAGDDDTDAFLANHARGLLLAKAVEEITVVGLRGILNVVLRTILTSLTLEVVPL